MHRNFFELLQARWDRGSFLCVGLDSDLSKIPEIVRHDGTAQTIVAFNRAIIDATQDLVCAYKPNIAFYESHGDEGWSALRDTILYINEVAPEIPVILDAKRADIGNTNDAYAASAFDHLHADALTVNPYPGSEALEPFLKRKDKGIIIWCRTSNGGAGEFQDLSIDGKPLYQVVAEHVADTWNVNNNCALVVGATYTEELHAVRSIVGDMPILIPGIGTQSGDLEKSVKAGKNSKNNGLILNASRAIIFASKKEDFADAARLKATELGSAIRKALVE